MKPPTCRTCGTEHWGPICPGSLRDPPKAKAEDLAAVKPVGPASRADPGHAPKFSPAPREVTKGSNATGPDTSVSADAVMQVALLTEVVRKQIEELNVSRGEIQFLKDELKRANKANSAAHRKRNVAQRRAKEKGKVP
jgi:hypothetical protein